MSYRFLASSINREIGISKVSCGWFKRLGARSHLEAGSCTLIVVNKYW